MPPLHPHHLRTLLPKLTNNPHRKFLPFLHNNRVRNMAVQALKRLIVYFDFQGFFRFLFGAVFVEVIQSFFLFVELVSVAAAEENLFDHKVAAVIIIVEHPVGDVMNVAELDFILCKYLYCANQYIFHWAYLSLCLVEKATLFHDIDSIPFHFEILP